MDFSPFNHTVKLCLQGMEMEDKGNPEGAIKLFEQAWDEAANDFEKYLSAYYIARNQDSAADRLRWFEESLQLALKTDSESARSAYPTLYFHLAKCYEDLRDDEKAKEYAELGASCQRNFSDKGPFYHGTKADLQVGDLLTPGGSSNYKSELTMNHIYFTALVNGAGLAAALAKGDGDERVYIVEPTGDFENDPNLTDKKFPGNPTRSYRSEFPLKIVGEVSNWARQAPDKIQQFREKCRIVKET